MKEIKWTPNMNNIEYSVYVMACIYLGIIPQSQY